MRDAEDYASSRRSFHIGNEFLPASIPAAHGLRAAGEQGDTEAEPISCSPSPTGSGKLCAVDDWDGN